MRLGAKIIGAGFLPGRCRLLPVFVLLVWFGLAGMTARAADVPPLGPPPPADAQMSMSSAGWLERLVVQLETEAKDDFKMLPDTPGALEREWRSFDREGSALGALVDLLWAVLAALVALCAERLVARGLSRRVRRELRNRAQGPTLARLLLLALYDGVGLAIFAGVFVYSRHWLMSAGATINLVVLSANVLIGWRLAALAVRALLRPGAAAARLIEVPDAEARRLARFLSGIILAIIALLGFERYGLMDVDSGASHIVGLIVGTLVFALYAVIVFRARIAVEALIRGRSSGLIGAMRAQVAQAWVPIGLAAVGMLMVFFIFGLSLGLLSYYHAFVSTLAVLFVVLVLEKLTERGWHDAVLVREQGGDDRLVARMFHRVLRVLVVLVAALVLAWIWTDAIELAAADAARGMNSTAIAVGTLFVAFLVWEMARLAIDRHLQDVSTGPKMPGADAEEEEAVTGSRLQTILPMVRAVFAAVIAVVALLIVLSHLGIDTAPLIAGAGVFGLAISFGSQSLVRDIISGLFYMWDDAFRIGEYIDTGRLRGTVEALGVRSVKLRHHNGPLHTVPYGQLGAVTNQSRDFATIKFNVRLEPGIDIELVRRTAKRIGLDMQEEPEIAAEVLIPLKLQGIVEVTETALVVRFKFTARPVKPGWIQREYLKRIYLVFAEKGITFASGALTLRAAPAVSATGDGAVLAPLQNPGIESLAIPAASRVA